MMDYKAQISLRYLFLLLGIGIAAMPFAVAKADPTHAEGLVIQCPYIPPGMS